MVTRSTTAAAPRPARVAALFSYPRCAVASEHPDPPDSATEGGEGETSLAITVKDNPDTAQRTANITLTSNNGATGTKTIRVTQEAKVLPASFSMTYNGEELPEEGFSLHYKGEIQYDIDVFPVNLEWNLKTEYEIGGAGWLEARKVETENIYKIHIQCNPNQRENTSSEARTARIVITTNVDGIGPFEIPVRQEGTPDYLSTIETDVDLGILSRSRVIASVNDDRRDDPRTMWDLILWDESIEYDFVGNFTGTGNKFCCKLYTEPIRQNDDNEYFLPNGTYTVTPETANPENPDLYYVAGEMEQGKWGYSHPAFPTGTWYIRMANDEVTGDVCISGGTLTVTRSGEEYTMTFDLTSDAGRKVTGSYRGTLKITAQ